MHFYGCSLNFTLSALPFERRLVKELIHNGSFSRELPEVTYSGQKGARGSALYKQGLRSPFFDVKV
tara:strand:- start:194 stop:391 length:198 start_codon:yes stop_codon:yes gene_type:complete